MNIKNYLLLFITTITLFSDPILTKIHENHLVDIVIAENSSPWLIPVLTPVVAIHNSFPILLSSGDRVQLEKTMDIIKAKKCLYAGNQFSYFERTLDLNRIPVNNCLKTSIKIAKHFWKESEKIVFVTAESTQALIQASVYAAIHKIPLVPIEKKPNGDIDSQKRSLLALLNSLQTKEIIVIGRVPQWAVNLKNKKRMNASQVQQSIISGYKTKKIRNVIVARIPKRIDAAEVEWVAPYLSLVRKAPIFFTRSPFVDDLEKDFSQYIAKMKVKPKTITLLGNDEKIYPKHINIPTPNEEEEYYEMTIEPFTLPSKNTALSYGVGRIPFYDLERASLLIARNFIHEKLLKKQVSKVVLAAPNNQLYLGETISRITAQEFKNANVSIKEYYSVNYDEDEIRREVEESQLFIYEGHVSDQNILIAPDSIYAEEFEEINFEDSSEEERQEEYQNDEEQEEHQNNEEEDNGYDNDHNSDESWIEYDIQKKEKPDLRGLPFVMLQSCQSLEQSVGDYIFGCGGVGIIGTTTNVHSGSGSSILKVICDDILYRNVRIGEALRNARNYFFCLLKLKELRNHKQMAKAKRVALSFRLWGDPELQILKVPKKRIHKTISSKLDASKNKYYVETPINWLPKCETENYYSRMFHDAKVAGLVKTVEEKEQRRIMQLYFFKEKMPKQWKKNNVFKSIYAEKYKSRTRSVFLPSADSRYIYILHLPKLGAKKEVVEFQFSEK